MDHSRIGLSGALACLLAGATLLAAGGCGRVAPHQRPPAPASIAAEAATNAPVPLAKKVPADTSRTYVGVFRPNAPFDMTALDEYAGISAKPPAIVMWYQPWANGMANKFDAAACASVIQRGAVPLITWEPWNPGPNPGNLSDAAAQPDFALVEINRGRYDGYIRSWARQIKAFGGPVMLRPLHEMNGNWYPWSGMANGNTPGEFVQAWRHVHDIFADEGATNVTWVWSINWNSVPSGSKNAYGVYYPGDDYVDWTGISGFNWGLSRPKYRWMTFDEIYREPLAFLEKKDKPIMLAELGCVSQGGDKAAWLADAYGQVRRHPKIKATVYYDHNESGTKGTQDWALRYGDGSAQAYADAVAGGRFAGAKIGVLARWEASLEPRDWDKLRSFQPIY